MQGKEEMIDDILGSAKKAAAAMIEEATAERDSEVEKLRAELEKRSAEDDARAAEEAEAVYAGKVKLGELEAGKVLLGAKLACVAAVYDSVAEKLKKMPQADYLALMEKLIAANCSDGDEVIVGRSEKRITAEFVKKVAKTAKKSLTLGKERGEFDGGVILSNPRFEIDLTFDAIVADLKDRTAAETAKKLGL